MKNVVWILGVVSLFACTKEPDLRPDVTSEALTGKPLPVVSEVIETRNGISKWTRYLYEKGQLKKVYDANGVIGLQTIDPAEMKCTYTSGNTVSVYKYNAQNQIVSIIIDDRFDFRKVDLHYNKGLLTNFETVINWKEWDRVDSIEVYMNYKNGKIQSMSSHVKFVLNGKVIGEYNRILYCEWMTPFIYHEVSPEAVDGYDWYNYYSNVIKDPFYINQRLPLEVVGNSAYSKGNILHGPYGTPTLRRFISGGNGMLSLGGIVSFENGPFMDYDGKTENIVSNRYQLPDSYDKVYRSSDMNGNPIQTVVHYEFKYIDLKDTY